MTEAVRHEAKGILEGSSRSHDHRAPTFDLRLSCPTLVFDGGMSVSLGLAILTRTCGKKVRSRQWASPLIRFDRSRRGTTEAKLSSRVDR